MIKQLVRNECSSTRSLEDWPMARSPHLENPGNRFSSRADG